MRAGAASLRRPARWLAAAWLSACAPAPVLRYATSDPADRWEAGTRLHPAEAGGLACTTSFSGESGGAGSALRFGIDLRNGSAQPVRIDPAGFRVFAPRRGAAWPAADPEAALADVEKRRRINEGNHAAYSCLGGVGSMLYLTASIASIGDPKAQKELSRSYAESEENDRVERENYESRKLELESVRREWSDGHLRRTDLDPGNGMSGALTFVFDAYPPPDTLVLQWLGPDGRQYDLGRFGRPALPADTSAAADGYRHRRSSGGTFSP